MVFLDFGEILLGQAVADDQVRFLGQEAEIGHRIHLRPAVIHAVEPGLRENVVHLQVVHHAKHVRFQRHTGAPILGVAHACQHVEDRIEPRAEAPAGEVARLHAEP